MNVFFIGMGYMGFERLKTIIKLRKKYNLNILGFYDPDIKSISFKNLRLKSEKSISSEYLKKNKISLCIISIPHYLVVKYASICLNSNSNINLLIEKPLGLNFKEAKKIKMPNDTIEGADLALEIGSKVKSDFGIKKLPLMIGIINKICEEKSLTFEWKNFK